MEPIEVLVVFRKDGVLPMRFKLGERSHEIKKVNLVHSEKRGRERKIYFSVSDDANAYRLSYATDSMKWHLEETAIL